jgi:hypothetical protein
LRRNRIKEVRDELNEGDQILVKVLALEGNKIKLSHRAIFERTAREAEGGSESVKLRQFLTEMDGKLVPLAGRDSRPFYFTAEANALGPTKANPIGI